MKKSHHLIVFLLMALACACSQPQGNSNNTAADWSGKKDINWKDSVRKRYSVIAYYYNNNIHDSLLMAIPAELEFCKEHELWSDYYDVWMMLGEEYTFSGEHSKAIAVAQEIHEDAVSRDNKYGLTAAEFITALVYDSQLNREEAARSFERALKHYPDTAEPFLKNSIYVYYSNELRYVDDSEKMRRMLDEWKAYIDKCKKDPTIPSRQFDNWLYYYHHSCYFYYLKQKDVDKAEQHVDSVVKHLEKTGWSQVTRNEILGYRVQLAIERKKYAEALRLNDQQLPGAKDLDINAYSEILKQRADILSNIGQWKDAYGYLHQHYDIVDSLIQAETRQQLNELNKRFEVDELKMQAERDRMQSERQRMYLLAVIGAIVVVGVIIFIFFRQRSARRMAALKSEQERMESELRIARDIQMSMVPNTFPQREGLDMYALMTPAREVGGDLYGYIMHGDMLYFCLGDVSGKGVPASLFMAQATQMFQSLANQGLQPAEICTRMNDALSGKDNKSLMVITFFVGLIDLRSGHLSFCNAGHNPPVIKEQATLNNEEQVHFLEMEANAPLGIWPELKYVGEEIESIKGCPFFIYTDGLNEAENQEQQQFGEKRLLNYLSTTRFESSKQVVEALSAEVEEHRNGAESNDDLTMMCIRVS